jgi:hypothetical protein
MQTEQPEPQLYEIRVRGWLDPARSSWFNELTITNLDCGEAILRGTVRDQAALHGLLIKIRDLNLALLSVQRIDRILLPR